MSTLKELLKKHCPDGVEYKTLEDVCIIYTGEQLNRKNMIKEGYPVINGGIQASGYTNNFNEYEETITISQGGASAGFVNFMLEKFWAGAHCYIIKPNTDKLINKYLFFVLKNIEIHIMELKNGAGIPGINKNKITKIKIPLPPIEVQKEIVRILDEFTEKTIKLQELLHRETILRKKQYEYYRDKLLFSDNFDKVNMSDICEIKYGKALKEKDRKNGEVEVYSSGGLIGWHNEYLSKTPSIIIGRKGSAGSVFYTDKSSYCIDTAFYINKSNCNLKFIYYVLLNFELHKHKKTDGVPGINRDYLYNLKIPVPPLEEQERIVKILDQFDTLCNDITRGLPAEIELRKKQYEYYRDKLLTFKEKKK
ncbi:restriction endonuclease subunit S [Brachyspira pilosicoli]|uniref:restriction endonuclease subunit S n=1 Tax=Brachyspira pilosicoli TaxID=52584 RepID=UPI0030063C9E